MYIKVHRMKNRPKLYFLKCTRYLQCTWGVRTSANARLNTMHPSTSVPAGPIRAGTGKVEIIISTGQHYGRPTTRQLDPARGHGKAWRQAQFQCQANACPHPFPTLRARGFSKSSLFIRHILSSSDSRLKRFTDRSQMACTSGPVDSFEVLKCPSNIFQIFQLQRIEAHSLRLYFDALY